MAAGILIGKFLPGIPVLLERFEYAHTSIPIAVLIWIMIYPMMLKVDFQSIKNVRRHPQGLLVSNGTSWLIKPFLIFGLASFFFICGIQSLYLRRTGEGLCGGRSSAGRIEHHSGSVGFHTRITIGMIF